MELVEKIGRLKKERNAVILAHNYQIPEVQDIADYVGDSLGLSVQASKTTADVIVFCGVYFMAETAKILSPERIVLIPDEKAGCPMADMITADQLRKLKAEHPRAKVLCYVNTTAAVKAECDICCTSGNAERIVREAFRSEDEVIFVPDQYLAHYVSTQVGRDFIAWKGFCPTHARILPEDILAQKKRYPEAKVIVHPECTVGVTSPGALDGRNVTIRRRCRGSGVYRVYGNRDSSSAEERKSRKVLLPRFGADRLSEHETDHTGENPVVS
jgi:quinolinate synthase